MTKKAAIALALIMLGVFAWGLFFEAGSIKIVINGQELTGPLKGIIGTAGLIVGLIALFCAAIFILFVFAGIGIGILAGVIAAGIIVAGIAFPFLLIVLLPLAIICAFIAIVLNAGG